MDAAKGKEAGAVQKRRKAPIDMMSSSSFSGGAYAGPHRPNAVCDSTRLTFPCRLSIILAIVHLDPPGTRVVTSAVLISYLRRRIIGRVYLEMIAIVRQSALLVYCTSLPNNNTRPWRCRKQSSFRYSYPSYELRKAWRYPTLLAAKHAVTSACACLRSLISAVAIVAGDLWPIQAGTYNGGRFIRMRD